MYARAGFCSTNDARKLLGVISARPPVGNAAAGGELIVPSSKNGKLLVRFSIKYGNGNTSYTPKPARIGILPSPCGSHETPTRGAKSAALVLKYAPPVVGVLSARLARTATLSDDSAMGIT